MSCFSLLILKCMMNKLLLMKKSKSLHDKVLSLREASQTISGSGNDNSPPIDEVALYYQAVGGKKKKMVYGLESQAQDHYHHLHFLHFRLPLVDYYLYFVIDEEEAYRYDCTSLLFFSNQL